MDKGVRPRTQAIISLVLSVLVVLFCPFAVLVFLEVGLVLLPLLAGSILCSVVLAVRALRLSNELDPREKWLTSNIAMLAVAVISLESAYLLIVLGSALVIVLELAW
jgi:hypothetical protein